MKQLISPPINLLFVSIGCALLGWLVWSMLGLKLLSEDSQTAKAYTKVEIPSSEALAVPPLRKYTSMIESPLFWESRKKIIPLKPEKKEVVKEVALVDKKLPEGRLIGIIDTGESMMAVFKGSENSHYLHLDDKWGSWKVTSIGQDSIELTLGGEKQHLELINDYSAPAANKNKLAARKQARPKRRGINLAESRRPNLPNNVRNLPHLASTQKQAPPMALPAEMTIKEALAARQRLMGARWNRK